MNKVVRSIGRSFLLLILSALLVYSIIYYFNISKSSTLIISNNSILSPIKTSKVNMLMVGDVLIHGVIYEESYDSKTNTFDFKPSFEEIKPIASKYDLAFYNQETILGGIDLGLGG